MANQLYTQFKTDTVGKLKAELGLRNIMQVPHIKKVVLNVGYGRQVKDKAHIDAVERTLTLISGQKPVHNKARKSISNFKTREGQAIGASVTLRGPHMYDFLSKLIHITLPRVRDFRGLNPHAFDRQGNYAIGFKEQVAFPEVGVEAQDKLHGLEVVISTSAKNKEQGYALLKALGFPFKS